MIWMIRDYTNDIVKVMTKDYYWIIWMIRDDTNDIIKVMIKDLLLDYMND